MNTKKIILFGIYFLIFVILVMYSTIPYEYRTVTKKVDYTMIVDVDKKLLFELMSDIKKYPEIFPENYVSVFIKNQTDTLILSNETIQELGFQESIDVQHVLVPFVSHDITILSGNAKNTHIEIIFEEFDTKTKLNISAEIHATGKLIPFAYIPDKNIHNAISTMINQFLDYLKNN